MVSEEGQIVDHDKKKYGSLKTKNKSNNSLAILSYKEVNIPFVSKLLN